jgi:hypothetical protein
MDKLTMIQKQIIIGTNHYIAQFNRHIEEESYGDTASYKILDRWISEILDVDYRNDIYNNMAVGQFSRIESVKNSFKKKFNGDWFIGDALKDIIYSLVHSGIEDELVIERTEQELRDMWDYFKSLVPELYPPKVGERLYEPTQLTYDGEVLYRIVK